MCQICPPPTTPDASIPALPPLAFAWTIAVTSSLISLLPHLLSGIRSPSQRLEGALNNVNQITALLSAATCPAASHCIESKTQQLTLACEALHAVSPAHLHDLTSPPLKPPWPSFQKAWSLFPCQSICPVVPSPKMLFSLFFSMADSFSSVRRHFLKLLNIRE